MSEKYIYPKDSTLSMREKDENMDRLLVRLADAIRSVEIEISKYRWYKNQVEYRREDEIRKMLENLESVKKYFEKENGYVRGLWDANVFAESKRLEEEIRQKDGKCSTIP